MCGLSMEESQNYYNQTLSWRKWLGFYQNPSTSVAFLVALANLNPELIVHPLEEKANHGFWCI